MMQSKKDRVVQDQRRPYQIIEITPTSAERAAGKFDSDNIHKILEGMFTDGVIMLRDVINPEHLDRLNEVMVPESAEKEKTSHKNFNARNIQHAPPLSPSSLFFEDIYVNPFLLQAVSLYLGPNAIYNFLSGNTCLPKNMKKQPVHSDLEFNTPGFPFYVVASIPLISSTPEVGATELWPGTHWHSIADRKSPHYYEIKDEEIEKYKGFQPTVPKGSIVLRDLRLWHAGTTNLSDTTRCMLALGFCSQHWRTQNYLTIPTSIYNQFKEGVAKLGLQPYFKEATEEEYLKKKDDYTFTFEEGFAGRTDTPDNDHYEKQ
eukprot:TRINITY_DN3343_c0_g1_i1.p1 TRINITY_DN3343_c0_g1~~TRINITY_DN3343_c0_g1_i1.p1  ORF type:complete len:317 (+),score=76.27 TRINITY_DN3343_c0_g1_i1:72-1022(+)